MEIVPTTQFLFMCTKHNAPLVREQPMLVHPNDKAIAVWVFDLSDMRCDEGDATNLGTECQGSWKILTA